VKLFFIDRILKIDMKIAIIGTGRVGSTTAFCLAQKNNFDELVLINRTKEKTQNLKMELMSSFPGLGNKIKSGDYKDANDADIVLISCGVYGAPKGQNLCDVNGPMIEEIMSKLNLKKESKLIVITTPVDRTVLVALKKSGLPNNQVIGFGGQLDVKRLKWVICNAIGNFENDFEAHYIGEHGNRGIPVFDVNVPNKEGVAKQSKGFFMQHISGSGIAYYAPAREISILIDALTKEQETVLDVSYYNEKEQIFITWPCKINKDGIKEAIELNLSEEQKKEFDGLIELRKTESIS